MYDGSVWNKEFVLHVRAISAGRLCVQKLTRFLPSSHFFALFALCHDLLRTG